VRASSYRVPDTDHLNDTSRLPRIRTALTLAHRHAAWISLAIFAALLIPAGFAYARYYRVVGRSLQNGLFSNTTNIFSAPRVLEPGSGLSQEMVVSGLRRAGYTRQQTNPKGWFAVRNNDIEVNPGPESRVNSGPATIRFGPNGIEEITTLDGNRRLPEYRLDPELIANIADGDREKRRLVTFDRIPPMLVKAVVSAEDKRFFEHPGFDVLRLAKAAYVDLKSGRKQQGASTITMQLARAIWLSPEKRWRRKFSEGMITLVLEQRLTKKEIFQYYANEVYLGNIDSFGIHGFGEASRAYFGKDISQLTLPEAALLAGMIQRPSYYNPKRFPAHAKRRRDTVLRLMRSNGFIDDAQLTAALNSPIEPSPGRAVVTDSPYFVALLSNELQDKLSNYPGRGTLQVYSTLDPDLERAAVEAIQASLPRLDRAVRRNGAAKDGVLPQVALVAIDPHTGAVKALVGGRDYGKSQLNHALSMRQPGSVFKPFVYAAALSTAVDGSSKVFTPASTVADAPETFYFNSRVYHPSNFADRFYGTVTLREALAKSMNLATLKLAQQVGYARIVGLAKRCGWNDAIQPTPSVALGAYETSLLEIAGAYSVFANRGEYVRPTFISKVESDDTSVKISGVAPARRVLDPRVAFLMDDMLQEVTRTGTAAAAGGAGLGAPTAGKTGTSRDGWFVGFTPNLLAAVWVGYDDNRELRLEGARSALPIWIEFMKRAVRLHPGPQRFAPPPGGVVAARVNPESGLLAGDDCDGTDFYFIAGTEPQEKCQPQRFNPFRWIGSRLWPG
jgi:penicillin-binding protein 1B